MLVFSGVSTFFISQHCGISKATAGDGLLDILGMPSAAPTAQEAPPMVAYEKMLGCRKFEGQLTCANSEVKRSLFQVTLLKPFLRQYKGECGSRHVFPSFFVGSHDYEGQKKAFFRMCDLGNPWQECLSWKKTATFLKSKAPRWCFCVFFPPGMWE